MRLYLVIAGIVVAALAVAIVPRLSGSDEPHFPQPGHAETLPAAVALTYARGVQVGDENIACGTMTTKAARAVGCGKAGAHPRPCGDFSIAKTRILHFDNAHATVEVGTCRIELVPGTETHWAVSEVSNQEDQRSGQPISSRDSPRRANGEQTAPVASSAPEADGPLVAGGRAWTRLAAAC